MLIPEFLINLGKESDKNQEWVDSLPNILKKISYEWNLSLGDLYLENASCSYVVSCTTKEQESVILKIGLPHFEATHEIDGLNLLNGNPTVRLLKFDKETNSMLLEKCNPGTSLKSMDVASQDVIICDLLNKIWKTKCSDQSFQSLGKMVSLWNEETRQNISNFPDSYLAEQGCKLKEQLINTTEEKVLLATDLHSGNVLKSQRKPWLVIDIKPHLGDRTYDLTQHLLNTISRLQDNPIEMIKRLADQANVNSSRLNDWLFARLASENNGIHQDLAQRLK